MSQRRHKRPSCAHEDCGSRRFQVGGDGFTYCEQGHRQSDAGLVIAEDTGELVMMGRTSRKKVESDAESGTTKVSGFTGTKAFEHYLLCMQLVLRKQLRWLIDVQHFPEELETLVRDLWALRLQKLQHKVSLDSSADTDTDAAAHSSRAWSSQSENESGTDTTTGTASTTTTTTTRRRRPPPSPSSATPRLTDLLALIHIGITLLRIPITVADVHGWVRSGQLLYYGALRAVPVGMRERLPGQLQEPLEPALGLRPETLRRRVRDLVVGLGRDFGMAPPALNLPLVLVRWVRALALPVEVYVATRRLGLLRGGGEEEEGEDEVVVVEEEEEEEEEGRTHFRRLRCPEIRLMALVVIATKLLFPWDGRPRFPQSATDLSALEMDWTEWARVQRAGRRLSGRSAETTASDGPLRFEDAFNMTEEQSLALADERLDEYLDWYQSNLASDEVRQRGRAGKDAGFRKALFSMFPVPDLHAEKKRTPMRTPVSAQTTQTQTEQTQQTQQTQQSSPSGRPRAAPEITSTSGTTSAAEGVARVQAALRPRRIVAAVESREPDHVPRFGSSYVQYRTVEELSLRSGGDDDDDDDDEEKEGENHGTTAMLFYEMAAELAGCELHSLVRAVFVMERRFMRLEHYLRRERRGGS